MADGDEPNDLGDFMDEQEEQIPAFEPLPSDPPPPMGSAIGSQFDETQELPPVVAPPPAPGAPASASGATAPSSSAPSSTTFGTTTSSEPAAYPSASPAFGADSGSASSKLPWIAAIIAAIVLLGGGAFFALTAFGASGGAASPEEGIDAVLAAIGEEDFVTVAELMEPSERRTLAEPAITELLPELVRLGVLDDSADAGDIEGVDVVFTDVEYRVERLVGVDDIAHVFLTGGEVSANIDSAALPFTDEIDTADLDQQESQTITEDPDDNPVVFVERDGSWFFSLWFTLAEAARLDAGERLPNQDEAPAPLPNDTPAEAVEGMFNALTSFDLEAMIAHTDPEEMAALYRYSPLFLADAQAALDDLQGDLRDEGITWEMTDFDFDVEENGDDAVVTMRGFTVNVRTDGVEFALTYSRDLLTGDLDFDGVTGSLTASTTEFAIDGEFDGSPFEGAISVDPGSATFAGSGSFETDSFDFSLMLDAARECSTFEVSGSDGTNESGCLEEEADIEGVGPILEALEDWPEEFPGLPMRARQTDGGWYISPISSVFDPFITSLEGLEEGDFDDVFGDGVDGAAGIFGFEGDDPFDIIEDGIGGLDGGTDNVEDSIDDAGGVIGTFSDPVLEDETQIAVADGDTEVFVGEIGENGFDIFFIDLVPGSEITITSESLGSGLDTTLRIVDPLGEQLAFNDDAPPAAGLSEVLDSQIAFVATQPGVYIIEVAGFSGNSVGGYELTVDRERAVDGGIPSDEPAQSFFDVEDASLLTTELDETQRFEETLTVSSSVDEYQITLEAGESLTVSVEAAPGSGIDPTVQIVDATGAVLAFNDDAPDGSPVGNTRDSFVVANITRDDEYFVQVGSFSGQSNGDYVMNVTRALTPAPDTIPLDVASGTEVVVAGTVEVPVIYSLDLEAGDEVTISVDADFGSDLDPFVSLLFGETEVGQNDDANGSLNSQLIVTAAETGIHTIVVEGFGGSRGAYQLTVQRN